jgi:presequence protease
LATLHGFELVREERIAELDTQARLYRHVKTGAQLLSLENKDENKVFGIGFFTPPPSSNGLTHILEHSVLCASRKYPVKEPFVELAKSSLNTFLNAMTFSDSTWYPVASTNLRDLRNLMDVYLDCVFYPQLPPHILRQEGWHYELENSDDPIVYKGVVFNEMKGNYSSPDGLIGDFSQQSLFPDTYYAYDAGGDPKVIPELTYEEFTAYHRKHYHPSNAMIYFYGDDEPTERLRLIDEYLRDFDAAPVEKHIPTQQPFTAPRYAQHSYAASDDGEGSKSFVTVNYALPEMTDPELDMGFGILQYILIGSSASPLRKALIDSGLGEGLTGGGVNNFQKFPYFSTGLKGIKPESAPEVERIIVETLAKLAQDGIEPEMIEAAMNSTEFALREANTGSAPRGLVYLFGLIANWPYDHDPFEAIRYEKPLEAIKARLANGERYFEGLIEQYLVSNLHRTTVLLTPDAALGEQTEREEAEKLAAAKAKMNADDLQQIITETVELKEIQVTPDSEDALATIPTLKLEDMEKQHKPIPTKQIKDAAEILYHDLPTNGIIYLDLALDMHTLPPEQVAYAGLLRRILLEIGTNKEDYVKFSQRIGRKIGGLGIAPLISMTDGGTDSVAMLVLRGKATPAQADDLLAIINDVLTDVRLDNKERFRQILMQEKARLESGIVPGGHTFAMTRLGAMLNEASWANEQIGGADYLFFVRNLAEKIESDW